MNVKGKRMVFLNKLGIYAVIICCITSGVVSNAEELKPGQTIEYRPFFAKRWKEQEQSTQMVPWEGKHVTMLTTSADLDPKVMAAFLERLDAGWMVYADLIGQSPRKFKQYNGKVTVAAVPNPSFTCGLGCGYVGAGGIEVGGFYANDYPLVTKKRDAFPHYYFYEMGRNYFVFGSRHDAFTTGFAVFMRYVCIDALRCHDADTRTRKAIEEAESRLNGTDLTFLQAFTTGAGMSEKVNRLEALRPSDQPVMYASAMLKMRRDYGGDAWVKRFFVYLARCPEVSLRSRSGATRQSLNWLLAASCAAKEDLSGLFVDRWRMSLDERTRKVLSEVDWKAATVDPGEIYRRVFANPE